MGFFIPALAQDSQVELRWLPERDTNGIRTIRSYSVDTLTGARELMWTKHYDRHGFLANPADLLTYDAHGRLIKYITFGDFDGEQVPTETCNITYAPDGTVQRIEQVSDYSSITYELLTHKTHPKYGLLDYTFRRKYTSNYSNDDFDTVFIRREYDAQGHLLKEEQGPDGREGYRNISYRYDASGRRIASSGIYYELADTVDYLYNDQGVLTGMKGLWYDDVGGEGEIVVSCHPDGTPIEKREYYRDELEWDPETGEVKRPDKPAVLFYIERYDNRGVLIYSKDYWSKTVTEYEIEYW